MARLLLLRLGNKTVRGLVRSTEADLEPAGTYRSQYHLRWRGLAKALDRVPRLKRVLAELVRRTLKRVFEPGLVTTERVVEYPFVFQHLGPAVGSVLDVGGCHSRLPIALASRGYRVVSLDFNPYPHRHPALRVVRGDIMRAPFAGASFSAVVAISVLEHVGIGHYGDRTAGQGDLHAVEEIARLLSPGGRAILSVPFGIAYANEWMRVYDAPRLNRLLEPLPARRIEYAVSRGGLWAPASEPDAARVDWTGLDRSVALIAATKAVDSDADRERLLGA